jgi:hypothetical protein
VVDRRRLLDDLAGLVQPSRHDGPADQEIGERASATDCRGRQQDADQQCGDGVA